MADEQITIRRVDLQALLDLATSSEDFESGFWDDEQVEMARKIAGLLGVDPILATPTNFKFQYVCQVKQEHQWVAMELGYGPSCWLCTVCWHRSKAEIMPSAFIRGEEGSWT